MAIFKAICLAIKRGESLRQEALERAWNEGWIIGLLYQADLEKRRHPRSDNGQFKAKHHADSNESI